MHSLQLLCSRILALHLDHVDDLGGMPVEMYLELLKRAQSMSKSRERDFAKPRTVARLEKKNPSLVCKETDEIYWKEVAQAHILHTILPPMPYPKLLRKCKEMKGKLERLPLERFDKGGDSAESSKEMNHEAVRQGRDALELLISIQNIPLRAIADTSLGKICKSLSKSYWHAPVRALSTQLVTRWRAAQKSLVEADNGSCDASLTPQGMVEGTADCRTWKELYFYLESLSDKKLSRYSERWRKINAEFEQNRKRVKRIDSPEFGSKLASKKLKEDQQEAAQNSTGSKKIAMMRAEIVNNSYKLGVSIGAQQRRAAKRKGNAFFG